MIVIEWCFDTPVGRVCVLVSGLMLLTWAFSPSGQRTLGLR
jgi:hypothetical protein